MRRFWMLSLLLAATAAHGWDLRGEAGVEGQWYPQDSPYVDWRHDGSATLRGDLYREWNGGDDIFEFIPYARLDEHDDRRTHGDIRELSWIHVGKGWEARVGIRKVFWGVTEGRHLVDVINQTDLVDEADGDEKLGQPMINLSFVPSWGTLDLFVLPGFRERTFPGPNGRPRLPLVVDTAHPIYESPRKSHRVDFAVRYQFFLGNLQGAVSHFSGTGRDPRFVPELVPGGQPELRPLYEVIEQTGLELTLPSGGWLWKFEGISRGGQGERFYATDGGFEYTQTGIFGSALDLGWLGEYLWENRSGLEASPFEHDWLAGNRLSFNDAAGTELLWTVIYDPHSGEQLYNLESSRRFGDSIKVSLEGRIYRSAPPPDIQTLLQRAAAGQDVFDGKRLSVFSDDDYLQLAVVYYF